VSALGAAANRPRDQLILVDASDRETGVLSKEECHQGAGHRHRAFSVFLFNRQGELLLQQRSAAKPLWPLYWSNTCCSHPRQGETVEAAARRRLAEELALTAELRFLYKFEYRAEYQQIGTEHELCWVFAGRAAGEPRADAAEIAAWRYVAPAALTADMAARPEQYTPWLRLEWPQVTALYLPGLAAQELQGRQPTLK